MRSIVLYGLGGADVQYAPIRYMVIPISEYSVTMVKTSASQMMDEYPTIRRVYEIDNGHGLQFDYRKAAFDKHNSIESRFIFRDLLETRGRRVI